MNGFDPNKLKDINDFESLLSFLEEELNWPLQNCDADELTFEYTPEEMGITDDAAVNINKIMQLRPFSYNQPWGIFFIDFENKKLPIVLLRRILRKLVIKKRPSANRVDLRQWDCKDLLFINSYGEENDKRITFTHFKQDEPDRQPTIRALSWSSNDTNLHFELCASELQALEYRPDVDPEEWRETWSAVFKRKPGHTIDTARELSVRLAKLAQDVRENAKALLEMETDKGPFRKIMKQFQQALIHDLNIDDFADMYAQTIAYGLLYTAISSHVSGEPNQVSGYRVKQLVLPTNKFLKEIMESFFDVGTRRWSSSEGKLVGIDFDELGVNDIVETLRDESTDLDAVLKDFNNLNPNEDPVIHFYELFLQEYDRLLRKGRGVYYTPQPVVSFIVRSVHEVLKTEFGLELGLADTITWGEMIMKNPEIKLPQGIKEDEYFVQILDPACGTGTFLVETIELVNKTMTDYWESQGKGQTEINELWNEYVPKKLLPRLYGFELMMAPYAIAHMKIGIKLYETGYKSFAKDKQRVKVYLTNTLEEHQDIVQYAENLDPAMAEETREANAIKQINSLTVVIGNPPYAGHSINNSEWISGLLRKGLSDGADSYFKVDGAALGERNTKWLNDDYVKFIRYSQYRLSKTGTGVLGFITNHAYLDNPTFRGMRQSLMKTFSRLSIIDLHGNYRTRETSPDGTIDENVFDIQQGVAVNIAVKKEGLPELFTYHHVWGTRLAKVKQLKDKSVYSLNNPINLSPISSFYLLCPQVVDLLKEWNRYGKLSNIIPLNSVGIVTARDRFTIKDAKDDVWGMVNDFIEMDIEEARFAYQLGEDVRDWKVSYAQLDIRNSGPNKSNITPLLYRPFEKKWTYYTGRSRGFICMPRPEVMRHMLAGENLGLITCRQRSQAGGVWASVGISRLIIESCAISNKTKEINSLFPLYLYPEEGSLDLSGGEWSPGKNNRTPNLDKAFVDRFSQAVRLSFISDGKGNLDDNFGPEDLLAYIYSVFHSLSYRVLYADFLKYDFPRVPVTSEKELFVKLAMLGHNLMSLHLMESDRLNEHITSFPVEGNNEITKVGETRKELADVKDGVGKLYINKTQHFDGLPVNVWNFFIGGYQVCHKWLDDRRKAKQKLSPEDIEHYHRIVSALKETINIMIQIDDTIEKYGGWPIK